MGAEPRRNNLLSLRDRELYSRINWFTSLRWLGGLFALLLLLFAWFGFGVRFPMAPVVAGVLSLFFYNAVLVFLAKFLRERRALGHRGLIAFANFQIVLDLLTFTWIVHFSGGVENIFIVFYIFHMVIASILLPKRSAFLQATLALALASAVFWLEYFGLLTHHHLEGVLTECLKSNPAFVAGVTVALGAILYAAVYAASSIAERLHEREAEIEKANDELRRLDQERLNYLNRVIHELCSPLSAMQSCIRVILDGYAGEVNPQQKELLERTEKRIWGLTDLVRDILQFSHAYRIERRQLHPIDSSRIAREMLPLFQARAAAKNVGLSAELDSVWILGERESIEQLLSNLLSNAIKYTPAGGNVSVSLRREGSSAHLSVVDTGIGIDPKDFENIFQEFYRSPSAKAQVLDGTGMGLPIVKKIVEAYAGTITVESTPGKGSVFSVKLPLARPSEPAEKSP